MADAFTSSTGGFGAQIARSLGTGGLILSFVSLVIVWRICVVIYRLTLHPLAKYPGPKLAAATRLWHSIQILNGQYPFTIHKLHEKYGPVVRLQPDELSFVTSQAWDDIYGFRNGKPEMSKETPFYTSPNAPKNIVTAKRDAHSLYRRLMSRGFSDAALREQEPMIQDMVNLFMRRMKENADRGAPVDMCRWYNFLTFDIIGELTFGETFGCLANSDYHPWVSIIFEGIKFIGLSQAMANYPAIASALVRLLPPSLKRKSDSHKEMTREKVRRRIESNVDRADFVSNLFNPKYNITEEEKSANASVLVIAGSETTATLLSGVTYYLAKNPEIKKKLLEEVRSAFSSVEEITFVNVNKLKYLLAVLNEGLRIFPPAPVTFARRVPEGGDTIDGNFVAGGSMVGVCIYAGHHSSRNWKNPESFIPERWTGDPAYENDDRQALKAFSHGPRNCLGKNLAYMEMRLIIARFIFEYDWKLDDSSDDWANSEVFVVYDKKPLNIKLIPVR